LYGTVIL